MTAGRAAGEETEPAKLLRRTGAVCSSGSDAVACQSCPLAPGKYGRVKFRYLGDRGVPVARRHSRWRSFPSRPSPRAECRELATKFGAVATLAPAPDGTFGQIADVVPGMADPDGADFVFESTGRRECVDAGIWLCRPFGCFVCQGNYGDGQVSFEFFEGHRRRLRLIFPSDDGYQPFRRASLRAVAFGAMPWGEVITHRISFEDMPAFYSDIYTGKAEHVIGAVVSWETAD